MLAKTVVLGLCARLQMFLSIKKELAHVGHVLWTRGALVAVYLLAVAFAAGVLTFIRISADTPVVRASSVFIGVAMVGVSGNASASSCHMHGGSACCPRQQPRGIFARSCPHKRAASAK